MELQFYPMSKKPDREQDEAFSETVIVYEVNLKTKEPIDAVMGYYNFDSENWSVLCDESLKLYCWAKIPNPKDFLQNKNWKTVKHIGYAE